MTKTENYQLSQWAASDLILREDFNRDNAGLEAALTGLQAGLDQEIADRELVMDYEANLRAIQITTKMQEAKDEAAFALALHQATMPVVKLLEYTVPAAAHQVDVDVSGFDWMAFQFLIIVPKLLTGGEAGIYMKLNDLTGKYASGTSNAAAMVTFDAWDSGCVTMIRMMPQGQYLTCAVEHAFGSGSSGFAQVEEDSGILAGDVTELNFVAASSGGKIKKDGKVYIYGIRL